MIDNSINSKVNEMIGSEELKPKDNYAQEDSVFTGESEVVAGVGKAAISMAKKLSAIKESRKLQPTIKKISAEEKLEIAKTADDIKNQTEAKELIETTTQPANDLALTEVTLGATENVQPKPIDINKKLDQEPIITPEELNAAIKKSKKKLEKLPKVVKGENLPKELLPPDQVFNLAKAGDLAPALDAIASQANIVTKNVSYADIAKRVEGKGFDSDFIKQLTGGNVNVTPENSYRVVLAEEWSAKQLNDIGTRVLAGVATNDDYQTAVKAIAFNSLVLRSVKGYKTNIAQSFGILKMRPVAGAEFEQMSDVFKSKEDIQRFFEVHKANEGNPAKQRKLIDAAATGKVQGMLGTLVSGMVSGTATLGRIVAGDLPRVGLRPAETLGSWGVGSVRGLVGIGSKNKTYAGESIAQIASLHAGIKHGFAAASYAWKNKTSGIGGRNRLDMQIRPEFFDIDPASNAIVKFMAGSYNFASAYGGRSVLTVSEFTKGVHYQMGLESLAMRKGIAAQELAIDLGKTEDEAFDAFTQASRETFENPPDDVLQEARYWGLESKPDTNTAVGKTTEVLDKLTSMKNPIGVMMKVHMPFLVTPMNDFIQAVERTPLKVLYDAPSALYKALDGAPDYVSDFQKNLIKTKDSILNDLNSGDYLKRDLAISRIAIGTGAIATCANYALEGNTTGAGPSDKAERERWLAQGALPFSRVEDISNSEGLSYEARMKIAEAKFGQSNNWSLGTGEYEGKLFRSYSGLSTVGYCLGMGAIYAENVNNLEEGDVLGAAAAASLGMYSVALEQPMLQGIQKFGSSIPKLFASETIFADAINNSMAWAVDNGWNAIVPMSGAKKQLMKGLDPTKREYPVDPDLPNGIAGVVAGYQQQMDLTAGTSYGAPTKTIFNETEKHLNSISGMRVSAGKEDKAFEIMTLAGVDSKKPPKTFEQTVRVEINGETREIPASVKLSADEYDKLLELANQENSKGFTLKQQVVNIADKSHFINGTADGREKAVESIFQIAFEKARYELYNGDSEQSFALRRRIQEKVNEIKRTLKRPSGVN